MTSSLSSTAAAAAGGACCKSSTRTSNSNHPRPAPPQISSPVTRSSSRRKLLLFSATAGFILPPVGVGQANPLSATNVKPPSTPYSQSQQQQQFGLDAKGRIRACPSTNPRCVSTNPTVGASCSLASPLIVPTNTSNANTLPDKAATAASLCQAILKTQRNAVIKTDEETPYGHYIQAEVDGGLTLTGGGRDVMEFLLNLKVEEESQQLVATYRCVATRVTFVYPFTTAIGDSKGQNQRIAAVFQELGWYVPDLLNAADASDHY